MQQYMETTYRELKKSRDKAELRDKGRGATVIKTLMGEVAIKRTLYKRIGEDGAIEHIYLLDEALELETIGNILPNLVEKITDHVCEISYREAAKAVSGLTGQTISHQGVRNVVQAVGERQAKLERKLVEAYLGKV